MKVGLNATCFNSRPAGATQRFVGIYGSLIKRHKDVEFVVYQPSDFKVKVWFEGLENVSIRDTPTPSTRSCIKKYLSSAGFWSEALKYENLDIFEGFNQPLVKAPNGSTIFTIHDIRGMNSDRSYLSKFIYKQSLDNSFKKADHVITVSETMKREILSIYPDLSISVVYNGIDSLEFSSPTKTDLELFQKKYSLPDEFILSVGHFEKRKNQIRLIKAIARLRDLGQSVYLLLIGNDSGLQNDIEICVNSLDLSNQVKVLSGVSDHELRCAYQLSKLFVFPSSYEGFGIPILESMAAGCPMVLSDISVFRELTEGQGVYFPYDDIELMALAIQKMLSSESDRIASISYGYKRVKSFSFDNLSSQVESIYSSLI